MTEGSAATPEGAALPGQALTFWIEGTASSASWQTCCGLACGGRTGNPEELWQAIPSQAAGWLQNAMMFISAGAPDIVPCSCGKSHHLPTALAHKSRSPTP